MSDKLLGLWSCESLSWPSPLTSQRVVVTSHAAFNTSSKLLGTSSPPLPVSDDPGGNDITPLAPVVACCCVRKEEGPGRTLCKRGKGCKYIHEWYAQLFPVWNYNMLILK